MCGGGSVALCRDWASQRYNLVIAYCSDCTLIAGGHVKLILPPTEGSHGDLPPGLVGCALFSFQLHMASCTCEKWMWHKCINLDVGI